MDAAVQVAIIGIITTLVTTAGVVVVAVINSRRERGHAAESAMERTLRERILLRDEQIDELKGDVLERDETINQLNRTITALDQAIDRKDHLISGLQEENRMLKKAADE